MGAKSRRMPDQAACEAIGTAPISFAIVVVILVLATPPWRGLPSTYYLVFGWMSGVTAFLAGVASRLGHWPIAFVVTAGAVMWTLAPQPWWIGVASAGGVALGYALPWTVVVLASRLRDG